MPERNKAPGFRFADAKTKLNNIFGHGAGGCLDPLLSFLSKSPILDVVRFDEFLKTPDDKSLNDWIIQKYGQDALTFVESLLEPFNEDEPK